MALFGNFRQRSQALRHWKNFNSILDANREIEDKLRNDFKEMIPIFKKPRIKSTGVILIFKKA